MSATSVPATVSGKYLTVVLNDEGYGIPVLKVREIIRLQKITTIPQMPDFVKGVINLRGRVVPIIDLRAKFGLRADYADRTCIVVVQITLGSGSAVAIGLIVDAVEDVAYVAADDIEPAPDFGVAVAGEYLLGIAKVRDKVKTLLDIDRVVAADLLQAVRERAVTS